MKKIRLGMIDVPNDYFDLNDDAKNELCEVLLDKLYLFIDERLEQGHDRIEFLREVLISSLESNEQYEQYEICQVINDCIKLLDAD